MDWIGYGKEANQEKTKIAIYFDVEKEKNKAFEVKEGRRASQSTRGNNSNLGSSLWKSKWSPRGLTATRINTR